MLQTTNHGASPLPNPVDASLAKPVPAAESGSRLLGLGTARLGAAGRQEVAQPVMPMRLSEAPVGAAAPAAAPSAAAAESVAHSQLLTAMIQTLQQQGVPTTLPQPEPEPEPEPPPQPRPRASEQGLWLTGHVREQQRRSREGQAETVEEAIELSNLNADADT